MSNLPDLPVSEAEAKSELARRELARRHFQDFARYVYPGYVEGWHTRIICDALEAVEEGRIRWLIIEAPPRHSKSVHVSQLFPAYAVGKDEDTDVIVGSYSGDLATSHGRETRNLIGTKRYQNVFKTKLAEDSSAKGKWHTSGKGAYNAVGVGGSATGKGADFFIVDDSLKDRKEADSFIIREGIWDWYRSVARTRLTPNGCMIVMGTRWHEDDLIGRILREEAWVDYFDWKKGKKAKWVRLTLKAIAEEDEQFRNAGEALWPERYSLEELNDLKKTLGSYEFSALYQANPVDDENREFKQKWFKYRSMKEVEQMETRKFATIDPNLKKSDESDWCGITRNYVNELGEYHFIARKYRVNSKDIIDLVFMLHDEGFEVIGIEEGAFSYVIEPFLKEEMRKRGKFPNVVPLKHNQTMKETRIRGLQPRYETGMIYHITGEAEDLEEQLLAFPKATNDDVADSAAYQPQIAEPPATARDRAKAYMADKQRRDTKINRHGV